MDTQNTAPLDIDPGDIGTPWQAFRVTQLGRRHALLNRLIHSQTRVTVADGPQPLYALPIWSMDLQRNVISLQAEQRHLGHPLHGPVWAVSNLDQCKLQFELLRPHWHQGNSMWLLKAALPDVVYALQRRDRTRLRLRGTSAPVFYVPIEPACMDPTAMVAINLHAGGCALWKPQLKLPMQAGMTLHAVEVQLDHTHILIANLTVRHISHTLEGRSGTLAGCAWEPLTPLAQRTLDDWLEMRNRPSGTLNLEFDTL